MVDWSYELNKNREKKIRSLEKKLESEKRISTWESKEKFTEIDKPISKWNEVDIVDDERTSRKNVFLRQLVAAAVLFFITVLGVRYPATEKWIMSAWNQTMPYDKLTAYYQELVGSRPTLLPVFSDNKKQVSASWLAPVKGKVVLSYNEQRKGIVIQIAGKSPVVAAKDGTVIFVGKKTGIGNTVIIRHEDGKQTWYGFLGSITPKINDKVKRGDRIGQAVPRSNHYFVYIALKGNGQFIDPTNIIPFR